MPYIINQTFIFCLIYILAMYCLNWVSTHKKRMGLYFIVFVQKFGCKGNGIVNIYLACDLFLTSNAVLKHPRSTELSRKFCFLTFPIGFYIPIIVSNLNSNFSIRGHSTNMWTEFCYFLTP